METVAENPARSRNALLIVDVQVGLVKLIPAEIRAEVLSRIETLLSRARASGTPVIYIQHDGQRVIRWKRRPKAGRFMRQ